MTQRHGWRGTWQSDDPVAEYEFLVGRLLDRETLQQAIAIAAEWGVTPHEVLLAQGWITPDAYIGALARYLGVPIFDQAQPPGRAPVMLDGTAGTPWQIAGLVASHESAGDVPVLAPPRRLADLEPPGSKARRLRRAVVGLLRRRPVLSAGAPTWRWQLITATVILGLILGGAGVAPEAAYRGLLLVLSLIFLPVVLLRVGIFLLGLWPVRVPGGAARTPDADLPVYTVLVPMFRESSVLRQLVDAVSALDYPAAKLDVLLVLESVDTETRAAAAALDLPGFIRVVVVPERQPRTKPKALNYALQFARGDYVVVYDAEDMPDRDQLRQSLATFAGGRPGTDCLQGRLSIHNIQDGWLVRQFALEYAVLFALTLPGISRLNLPVPLGGTSNHFPRTVLQRWAGWDPYNVTEDADLGIRLARAGGRVGMLDSTTWEEAPDRFNVWLKQRTRWLKGWMQTYLVHTRQPWRLARDLGPLAFLGFHLYSGGLVLSALVFPIFCALAAIELWHGIWFALPASGSGRLIWMIAIFNLSAAYICSVLAAVIAAWRQGRPRLALGAPFMPVYWLLISVAAYRALYQLLTAPHHRWEKTEHRGRRTRFPT